MSADLVDLDIERPVAGGRMLARHDGRVVLVSGAIPGERVRARIERRSRDVFWAHVEDVLTPSPDRRTPVVDPACAGMTYSHIAYDAQRRLKASVIADAFRRLGKITLPADIFVDASPEQGYRLRARIHVQHDRFGFFRENSHVLCDAALTGQLHADALPAIAETLSQLGGRRSDCAAVTIAENVRASQRVLHLEPREGATLADVASLHLPASVSGVTTEAKGRFVSLGGEAVVTDSAEDLFGDPWSDGAPPSWRRHAPAFFQGNRFLTGPLVRHVLEAVSAGPVADFYAGVGLFSVALAARGMEVLAVEGDAVSGRDLAHNASTWTRLSIVHDSVERAAVRLTAGSTATAIVDPPRTGMSTEALSAIAGLQVRRLVYVSCDPPTLARDASRLRAAGYALGAVRAFDLFPNTAHVETVAVFDRQSV